MNAHMFQRLDAGHDRNGNPKRLFVIMNANGDILKVIEEGYGGMPKECKGLIELVGYRIPGDEYRAIVASAKATDRYVP